MLSSKGGDRGLWSPVPTGNESPLSISTTLVYTKSCSWEQQRRRSGVISPSATFINCIDSYAWLVAFFVAQMSKNGKRSGKDLHPQVMSFFSKRMNMETGTNESITLPYDVARGRLWICFLSGIFFYSCQKFGRFPMGYINLTMDVSNFLQDWLCWFRSTRGEETMPAEHSDCPWRTLWRIARRFGQALCSLGSLLCTFFTACGRSFWREFYFLWKNLTNV